MTNVQGLMLCLLLLSVVDLILFVLLLKLRGHVRQRDKWLAEWWESVTSALRREPIRAQSMMDQIAGVGEQHQELRKQFDNLVTWVQGNLGRYQEHQKHIESLAEALDTVGSQQQTIYKQVASNLGVLRSHSTYLGKLTSPLGFNPSLN